MISSGNSNLSRTPPTQQHLPNYEIRNCSSLRQKLQKEVTPSNASMFCILQVVIFLLKTKAAMIGTKIKIGYEEPNLTTS